MGLAYALSPVGDIDQRAPLADTARGGTLRKLVRAPELFELRAFCAATDFGSISGAARVLRISQPALSKRLRALESVAGTSLLERSTTGVKPTRAGSHLYAAARRVLADASAVETVLTGVSGRAEPVRLASSATLGETWLPSQLVDLQLHTESLLSVEIMTANSAMVRRAVRDGASDLGLALVDSAGAGDDGLTERVILDDELVLAVPTGHPWSTGDDVGIHELGHTPVILGDAEGKASRLLELELARAGVTQARPVAEIGSTGAALAAARARGHAAMVSRSALRTQPMDGLVVRSVRGLDLTRRFALVFVGWIEDLAPEVRTVANHLLGWHGLPPV